MAITSSPISDSETKISLGETFDFNSVDEFRHCYESIDNNKINRFTIDFRKTHFLDSSALGMLINMHKYLDGSNASIRIINANDQVKKLFKISRFDKKFDIE